MTVSVRQLRSRLSEYLDRVEKGEEVTITRLGKPVGRLVSAAVDSPREQSAMDRLDRFPWIRPGRGGQPKPSREPIPWNPGEKTLSELLIEMRR